MKKYAVIFKTKRDLPIPQNYQEMNNRMVELVSEMDGFIGVDSVMDAKGKGFSISYWTTLEAIKGWKDNLEHKTAQEQGKNGWYKYYKVEVCELIEEYEKP